MRVIHHISVASTPEIRRELAAVGIVVAERDLVSFDVDEASAVWPWVETWVDRRGAVDIVSTKFSKEETDRAAWLTLVPDWHHGYPQPDEDAFGYRDATYDLRDWCERCGIGLKQKAPFQMKGEPKWGRRGILQLNWVFDEFFVLPEVWTSVFKPHQIPCRSVTNRKGVELKTVVQLVTNEVVGIVTDGLSLERCPECHGVKYLPATRGPFPALTSEPSMAMVKTKEYFGSGGQADKAVIISQKVGRALVANRILGASVEPVQAGRPTSP
jgi:hypothetical protein